MDKKTVIEAIQGKECAFSKIYEQTVEQAHAIAYSVVKDEHDAWDVVQDAYIKMWQSLDKLQDPDKLEAWFGTIVRNKALDFLDSKEVKHSVTFSDMESTAEDESFDYGAMQSTNYREFIPEEAVDYQETQRILWGLVNELPDKQRECMLLRWRENMKIKEISEATGYPEATVKSCLNYGRKKMEEALKKLEKEGTKLYGITPLFFLPFLRWMLGGESTVTTTVSAANAAATAAAGTTAGVGVSASASAGTASAAVGVAASGAAKVGIGLTVKQIIAVICAAVVIGTGSVVTANLKDQNTSQNSSTNETVATETGEDLQNNVPQMSLCDNEYVITCEKGYAKIADKYFIYEIPQVTIAEPDTGINSRIYEFCTPFLENIKNTVENGEIRSCCEENVVIKSSGKKELVDFYCSRIIYYAHLEKNVLFVRVEVSLEAVDPTRYSSVRQNDKLFVIDVRNGQELSNTGMILDALDISREAFLRYIEPQVRTEFYDFLNSKPNRKVVKEWEEIFGDDLLEQEGSPYSGQELWFGYYLPYVDEYGEEEMHWNQIIIPFADLYAIEENEEIVVDNTESTVPDSKTEPVQLYQEASFKGKYNDISCKMPMFTIDSPDAKAINQELLDEYGYLLSEVAALEADGEKEPEESYLSANGRRATLDYEVWYVEDAVTLCVKYVDKGIDWAETLYYSIYMDSGERVDKESVMQAMNMNEDQLYQHIATMVEEDYRTKLNAENNYNLYDEKLIPSVLLRENLMDYSTFYYDKDGSLMLRYTEYFYAGRGRGDAFVKIG